MDILIASDHAGFELKEKIKKSFSEFNFHDLGTTSSDSVDYPDFAKSLAQQISDKKFEFGILVCGTGIGMSMTANKFKNVRAALCHIPEAAKATREHNNANVLCLGSRTMDESRINEIIKTFLNTKFEGGRHSRRVEKIDSN